MTVTPLVVRDVKEALTVAREAHRVAREAFGELERVEDRMKGEIKEALFPISQTMADISRKLGDSPAPDGTGGSGIQGALATLDRRIKPFEKFQERAVGAVMMGSPLLVVIWFLTQDPVKRALGIG